MKTNTYILIVIILYLLFGFSVGYYSFKHPIKTDSNLDSLNKTLMYKDSIISYKDKQVNSLIQSDSIRMNIINKSINQIKYEIKKNSSQVFNVSDSYFQQYVDSLRTKGFNKIQH